MTKQFGAQVRASEDDIRDIGDKHESRFTSCIALSPGSRWNIRNDGNVFVFAVFPLGLEQCKTFGFRDTMITSKFKGSFGFLST